MIPLLDIALHLVDKIIPDPAQKAEAQLKILQLQQEGEFKEIDAELQMAQGQIDINKEEAKSEQFFKAGWRPGAGWVCVCAFALNYVIGPMAEWIAALYGNPIKFPVIDMGTMMPVLLGMLGLGVYRTKEKLEGKA